MGYASYLISGGVHDGEMGGYGHESICDAPGCEEPIDRGLAYLCGRQPGGDEHHCGGYFCGEHLYLGGAFGQACDECYVERTIGLTYVCRTPHERQGQTIQGCGAGTTRHDHEPVPVCPICRRPMRSLADEVRARLAEVNIR